MKRTFILLTLLLLFVTSSAFAFKDEAIPAPAAQTLPTGEWWAWVFVPQSDELHLLNEDGIQATIPRPQMPNEAPSRDANPQVSISPDSRYLVLAATLTNGNTGIGFYSLENRIFTQIHEAAPNEYVILATGQPFASSPTMYDPSGQFIAIGLATPSTNEWRVIVFDVPSGNALHVIDNNNPLLQPLFPSLSNDVSLYPKVVYFEGETIHAQLISYDDVTENNPTFAWQPLVPQVEISSYQRSRLDILPSANLAVFPYVDPLAERRSSDGTFLSFNALARGAEGTPTVLWSDSTHYHWSALWAADGELVLFSTGISEVELPRWNALHTESGDVDILDASIREVYPLPDGFLSVSETGVVAFHPVDNVTESETIWFLEGQPEVYIIWGSLPDTLFGLTNIPDVPQAIVGANNINIRQNPGNGGLILETVQAGVPLALVGRLSDQSWLQVTTLNGTTGWVFANLLQVNVDVAALPIVNASIVNAPTRTSVPPSPQPPIGPPTIEFFISDDTFVQPGSCVTLAWSVVNAETVLLSYAENSELVEESVPAVGSSLRCVNTSDYPYWTNFGLKVINGTEQDYYTVTIWVSSAY